MKNPKDNDLKPMPTWRVLKNVIVVSLAFMVHFLAFRGFSNLQSSVNAASGLGTVALATVYAGLIVSSIFLPAAVIRWLGTKQTMAFSFVFFMPYLISQWYPSFYTMIPAAFIVGIGAGPLWCGKCTYLSELAEAHHIQFGLSAETLLSRFFAIFFMIYQLNQVWGNLISSLVLNWGDSSSSIRPINHTMIHQLCGANFVFASKDAAAMIPEEPSDKIQMITGIYLACMVTSSFIVAMGLDSMRKYESCRKVTSRLSGFPLLAVTVKHMAERNQQLLIILNFFIGQNLGFFTADFTVSFVSCALGTGSVGYVMMAYGLPNAVGCLVTAYIAKLYGRLPLMIGALIIHGGTFTLMLLWHPHGDQNYVIYIIPMLFGICDSVWTVQLNALYGVLFRGKEEAAFSNLRLWEAIGYIFSFIISSHITTRYKIYMLLFNLIVGVVGYLICEYGEHKSQKKIEKEKIEIKEECVSN